MSSGIVSPTGNGYFNEPTKAKQKKKKKKKNLDTEKVHFEMLNDGEIFNGVCPPNLF